MPENGGAARRSFLSYSALIRILDRGRFSLPLVICALSVFLNMYMIAPMRTESGLELMRVSFRYIVYERIKQ